jgi:hypothetical protein
MEKLIGWTLADWLPFPFCSQENLSFLGIYLLSENFDYMTLSRSDSILVWTGLLGPSVRAQSEAMTSLPSTLLHN